MPSLCHGTDAGAGASAQRQRNASATPLRTPSAATQPRPALLESRSPDPAGPGELPSNATPASSRDKQKNPDSVPRVGVGKITRQRPTLPQSSPCSTIGSDELNFRVRDGIGCGLVDIATGNLWASKSSVLMLRCATRRSAGRVGSRGLRPASPAEPHLARTSSSACSARTPNTNLHVCLSE